MAAAPTSTHIQTPNPMSHSVGSAASFTKLGQRLENLHLVMDAEPEQEKPINYSMKYSEAPQPQVAQPPVVSTNPPVFHSQGSAFVKPAVRAGNYVSQSMVNNVPAHSNKQYRFPAKAIPDPGTCNAYHGNLDTETAPTNFSTRFVHLDETRNSAPKYMESEHLSETGAQAPSLFSYNDSTLTSSPSEKPARYCTEGTPTCFSRVGSSSSLHSHSSHSKGDVLQSIDESDSFDTSQNVTLKLQSANTSAYHGESAGGGESGASDSSRQASPLMFPRGSSLSSLSSFDAHSVHSSVVSDYSGRASEVVSLGELPDSPSNTTPASPSRGKSPVRFVPEVKGRGGPAKPDPLPQKLLDEVPKTYATEGSPGSGFLTASSLSAITFEDEPNIQKEPEMRRVPLGQEDGSPPKADYDTTFGSNDVTVIENRPTEDKDPSSFLDDDNDDLSEGEKHLLMECVSLGMPTKV